ncbi:hypothetical protein MKK58_14575 [Methylobacterium sp. J-078]|uniref:hypothetical protein n=1 Tax=Methylobacterium sp. J-078 TaxID=2836657 RepID=UPI001FB9B010|nr:hypothetical protein [Methylobacterium sp. J-078]MCJ2045744.1 hypothetical protein [Methylobacterium sp. J-078]
MALFGFGGRRAPADQGAREGVIARVRRLGGFDAEVIVKVSEIVCADPACPGLETVILIMVPGDPTRAVKIARAMAEIGDADVAAALASAS